MKTKISLSIIVFISLLNPYVKIYSYTIPLILMVMIFLPIIYFYKVKVYKKEIIFIFSLATISYVVIILIGMFKGGDFSTRLLYLVPILVLIYYSSQYIIYYCNDNGMSKYELYNIIVNVLCFNSIVIIFLTLNVINSNVFYNIIYTNPLVFTYPILRYPGFTYDAFSYISVLTALTLLLNVYLYSNNKVSTVLFLFKFSLLFIAIVLTGRMGLVVFFIGIIFIKINFKMVMTLTFLFFIALMSFNYNWGDFEWIKGWSFAFIGKILDGNFSSSDSSVSGVLSLIFFPNNIIIGDNVSFLDVKSDLGIIRLINSNGFFGVFLFVIYIASFVLVLIKNNANRFGFFLVFCLLFLNLKDVYIVSPYGITFFIMLFLISPRLDKIKNSIKF